MSPSVVLLGCTMSPSFLDLHMRMRRLRLEDVRALHSELRAADNDKKSRERADYVLRKTLSCLPVEAKTSPTRRVNALILILVHCRGTSHEDRAIELLCGTRWRQAHGRAVEEALVAMGPGIGGRLAEAMRPVHEPSMGRPAFEACLRALVRLGEVSAVPVIVANLSARRRGHRAMLCALEELTVDRPQLRDQIRSMIRERASAAQPALEQQFWPAVARGGMSDFRLRLIRARFRFALRRFHDRDRAEASGASGAKV